MPDHDSLDAAWAELSRAAKKIRSALAAMPIRPGLYTWSFAAGWMIGIALGTQIRDGWSVAELAMVLVILAEILTIRVFVILWSRG